MKPVVVVTSARRKSILGAVAMAPVAALMNVGARLVLPHAFDGLPLSAVVGAAQLVAFVTGLLFVWFCLLVLRPNRLTIDDEGLVCQEPHRTRIWRWSEIRDVGTRRAGSFATKFVTLRVSDPAVGDHTVGLPANWETPPEVLADMIMEAKANAGAGLAPLEPPGPRPVAARVRELVPALVGLGCLLAWPWMQAAMNGAEAQPTSPPPSQGLYGAIAASPSTGKAASSWRYGTAQSATWRALRDCSANAGDCAVKAVYRDSCAAYVVSDDKKASGFAQGSTMTAAINAAVTGCRAQGGVSCQIAATSCAYDPVHEKG